MNKKNICNYSNKFRRTYFISTLLDKYLSSNNQNKVSLVGRVILKRVMGNGSFIEIQDVSGKIQIYISKKNLSNNYESVISYMNLGDIIGVRGTIFKTRTNEVTLRVYIINFLSKNLNLYPDKWKGLLEKEICYRQRYLDLMVNSNTRNVFILRSKIIHLIRMFFLRRKYLEVETPIMQMKAGGALAKPFVTFHNYLNSNLYLRISPELYLKRLIVGGFERVFEIGKNFRNEGVSNRHNPEFTMIEFYQAYSDYKDLICLTENLFKYICKEINNSFIVYYNDIRLNFFRSFEKITFIGSILLYNADLNYDTLCNFIEFKKYLLNKNIDFNSRDTLGNLQFLLFEKTVEKNLIQPTFILFYPVDVSPLAKTLLFDDNYTERFELYICGKEIANGFSELNDPIEQAKRFKHQIKNNDSELELCYDEDYIKALEYGLPPTAGEGIGLDRLVMLFTNSSTIKDVLFFPLMKIK